MTKCDVFHEEENAYSPLRMRMFGVNEKGFIIFALNGNTITEAQKNLFKRIKYRMIITNFSNQFEKIPSVLHSGTDHRHTYVRKPLCWSVMLLVPNYVTITKCRHFFDV